MYPRGIQKSVSTYDLPDSGPPVGEYSGVKTENTQSGKICLNFNFRGGGGSLVWNSREGLSGEFGHKFTVWGKCTETCLCITDSLSHTTYVETNELRPFNVSVSRYKSAFSSTRLWKSFFFFNFWRTGVLFVGPLIPLFWTSGEVSSGFQSQSGFCLIWA